MEAVVKVAEEAEGVVVGGGGEFGGGASTLNDLHIVRWTDTTVTT